MKSNSVKGYLPSTCGFQFANSFPSGTAFPAITIPTPFGNINVTLDANAGLCGGFVFASLDLFLNNPRTSPPNTGAVAPPDPSPIFNYLTQRLIDSFGTDPILCNGIKDFAWTETPNTDFNFGAFFNIEGLARHVINEEWPNVMADIDSGKPSPLALVMNPACGIGDIPGSIDALRHCHQVLAYAYNLDNSNNLTLKVYDPNDPKDDNSTISLNISNTNANLVISAPAIEKNIEQPAYAIRGFFRSQYSWKNPAPMSGPPPNNPVFTQIQFVIGTGNDDAGGGQNGSGVTADVMLSGGSSFTLTLRKSSDPKWNNYTVKTVNLAVPSTDKAGQPIKLAKASDVSGIVINLVQNNPGYAADNWDINTISASLIPSIGAPVCLLKLVGSAKLSDGSTGLVRLTQSAGSTQLFAAGSGCP